MTKLTKRMRMIYKKIHSNKKYDSSEAIIILKEVATAKFIESVDIAVNLDIDPRKTDQNIRGSIVLPHGSGRNVYVAVFTQGINVELAHAAGADVVGMNDLAEKILKKEIKCNVVIASPDTMHIVSKLGKILGPRGLMPNPKVGTITTNIAEAVKKAKSGQVYYRNDKNGIIHSTIGKINFDLNKLKENLEFFITVLKKEKPIHIKGIYIKKISLSTTMSASITINQNILSQEST